MSVGYLCVFFGEMSIHVFCPFLIGLFGFWVLICISSLYILNTKPISGMSFANIFSRSIGFPLALLMKGNSEGETEAQELFVHLVSHLVICRTRIDVWVCLTANLKLLAAKQYHLFIRPVAAF